MELSKNIISASPGRLKCTECGTPTGQSILRSVSHSKLLFIEFSTQILNMFETVDIGGAENKLKVFSVRSYDKHFNRFPVNGHTLMSDLCAWLRESPAQPSNVATLRYIRMIVFSLYMNSVNHHHVQLGITWLFLFMADCRLTGVQIIQNRESQAQKNTDEANVEQALTQCTMQMPLS